MFITTILCSFYMMQFICRRTNIGASYSSCTDSDGRLVVREGFTEEVRNDQVLEEQELTKGAGSVKVFYKERMASVKVRRM